jgi:hypothetical protein
MITSISLSLSRIDSLDITQLDSLRATLSSTVFDQSEGTGFQNVAVEEYILSAVLVKRSSTFIQQLNPESGVLDDSEIFVYTHIQFCIDYRYHTLDVFGPLSNASKVRTVLRPLLRHGTSVTAISLLPHIVVPKFNLPDVRSNVETLSVNNFRHREGMIGKYTMRINLPGLADEILDEYQSDVVQAQIRLILPSGSEFDATFSQTGQIKISGQEDELADGLLFCKSVLLNTQAG